MLIRYALLLTCLAIPVRAQPQHAPLDPMQAAMAQTINQLINDLVVARSERETQRQRADALQSRIQVPPQEKPQ